MKLFNEWVLQRRKRENLLNQSYFNDKNPANGGVLMYYGGLLSLLVVLLGCWFLSLFFCWHVYHLPFFFTAVSIYALLRYLGRIYIGKTLSLHKSDAASRIIMKPSFNC